MEHDTNEPPPNLPATTSRGGWTAERQQAFLTALAACGCVRDACKSVGMSRSSAYALRAHPAAVAFRGAWDAAIDCAMSLIEEAALARAVHGVPRPIFYQGEQVGEWRHHDDRLAMFLLRYRRPLRFGSHLDRLPPPPPLPPPPSLDPYDNQPDEDEPMSRLDGHFDDLFDLSAPPPLIDIFPRANDSVQSVHFDPDCDRHPGLEQDMQRGSPGTEID